MRLGARSAGYGFSNLLALHLGLVHDGAFVKAFHTCVTAGPMLRSPLKVVVREVVERDGFVFADLVPAV